jgi:hypothetical protein
VEDRAIDVVTSDILPCEGVKDPLSLKIVIHGLVRQEYSQPGAQPLEYFLQRTLFESENERQKIEPVLIPLPKASRNFPDVKTRNEKKIYNWTSEIIPFIRFGKQRDRT